VWGKAGSMEKGGERWKEQSPMELWVDEESAY
jgi:hypothetical protein